MGKIFYQGHDITNTIERKEKKIIELYSQQRKIPFETAEIIYSLSNLRKAFRNVVTDLWTQSEQYIVEAYSDILDEVDIETILNYKKGLNVNFKVAPTTLFPWQKIIEVDKLHQTINMQKQSEEFKHYFPIIGVEDISSDQISETLESFMNRKKQGRFEVPVITEINEAMFTRTKQDFHRVGEKLSEEEDENKY